MFNFYQNIKTVLTEICNLKNDSVSAFEMQEFMRLLPFLSMTEAGEGMTDMMLPMMILHGSGQF